MASGDAVTTVATEPVPTAPTSGVVSTSDVLDWQAFKVCHLRFDLPVAIPESSIPGYSITVQLNNGPGFAYQNGSSWRTAGQPGNIKLFDENQPRIFRVVSGYDVIKIELMAAFVDHVIRAQFDKNTLALVPAMELLDPQIERIAYALNSEVESGGPTGKLFSEALATALTLHLLRHYAVQNHASGDPQILPRHLLQRATDYIQANLSNDISLHNLATELAFSLYHFARLFKQATGLAPHQYLIRQRMDRAKWLLSHTTQPTIDIALEVGYANRSHFTTLFKKTTGMTPAAYRAMTSASQQEPSAG